MDFSPPPVLDYKIELILSQIMQFKSKTASRLLATQADHIGYPENQKFTNLNFEMYRDLKVMKPGSRCAQGPCNITQNANQGGKQTVATFKVGDKVHLIPFKEAMKLQEQEASYVVIDAHVHGISERTWNELAELPGEVKEIRVTKTSSCSIYRVQFNYVTEVEDGLSFMDIWNIPEFAMQKDN